MGAAVPKQYSPLMGKPVLVHTLSLFEMCEEIDHTVIVAAGEWHRTIWKWAEQYRLAKVRAIALAGEDRQLSILNGLTAAEAYIKGDRDGVVVQDAARPLTSRALLQNLLHALEEAPAVLPALPITDTVYSSQDGNWAGGLLDRSQLYAGQAPEAFRFREYLDLYRKTPKEKLCAMSGSSQLPYCAGWKIKMIPGERDNLKITYPVDMTICQVLMSAKEEAK